MRMEDLDEVMRIETASFSSPWSKGMFQTEIKDNPFSTILIAKSGRSSTGRRDAGILGYCCFWLIFGEIHVMNLAVHPDCKRTGVGSVLVEEMLSIGRGHGVKKIHLEVRRSNKAAIRLYEKFGFQIIASRPNYYTQPLEDALLMGLELDTRSERS